MLQRITFARVPVGAIACIGAAVLLSGCGSVKLPSLSTGSLGSTQQSAAATAAPAVKPDDPIARAVQVGATIARAQKCGYFFDPEQLKANYLAAEAVRYPAPDVQQKVHTAVQFSRLRVGRQIAQAEGYCNDDRTSKIKSKLTKYLAGDYTAEVAKQQPTAGFFGAIDDAPEEEEKFDPEKIFAPPGTE